MLVQVKRVNFIYAFSAKHDASQLHFKKALHDPWCLLFSISMGKSSWVHSRTQGLFPPIADDMLYQGFCKNYLHPAGDED
jgi:hypothetical protein